MISREAKIFSAEKFRHQRDWLYFCFEYDLAVCEGCQNRAIRRKDSPTELYFCQGCEPAMHPDLILALRTQKNVTTRCGLCHESVALKDCWISEDCRRLYCAEHLQPLKQVDRFQLARHYLQARVRGERRAQDSLRQLERHSLRVDCGSCSFNALGVYDGDRLVEIDRTARACDCAPDTLNCADIDLGT